MIVSSVFFIGLNENVFSQSISVPKPPPRGISAWFYDTTQARVDSLNAYNKAVSVEADGADRQVKYLFPYGGSLSIGGNTYGTQSVYYDPTVSQFYESRLPSVYMLPNMDSGDGATFANWSTADQEKLAADIATTILSDPNAAGVQLDIEPFNAADVPFYSTLKQLLNAHGKVVAAFTGSTGGSIYGNVDIIAFSGYDLGISPVTPSNYQTTLNQYVTNALSNADSSGSYFLLGMPAGASYEEYSTETGTCSTNTGYTQEQWFQAAVSVLCQHYSDPQLLGASLWGFNGTGGLEIPNGSGCFRNPGEPPADNWTFLEDMNPTGCTFYTPTFTATPMFTSTFSATHTQTSTGTVTSSATLSATQTYTNTQTSTMTHMVTSTRTNTVTCTATNTTSNTATHTMTHSPSRTGTSTATSTSTHSPTNTLTYSPTNTQMNTATSTVTYSLTATVTQTETSSSMATNTPIPKLTNTRTATSTMTSTGTAVNTETLTPSYTPTSIPAPVVYPNPVSGPVITLQLPGNNLSHVKVEIFTLAFREVRTINVSQVAGNSLLIQLVDKDGIPLADGLYYFRISVNGQNWIKKVLVLR